RYLSATESAPGIDRVSCGSRGPHFAPTHTYLVERELAQSTQQKPFAQSEGDPSILHTTPPGCRRPRGHRALAPAGGGRYSKSLGNCAGARLARFTRLFARGIDGRFGSRLQTQPDYDGGGGPLAQPATPSPRPRRSN